MLDRCRITASSIGELDVLNNNSIAKTIDDSSGTHPDYLIVTDQNGIILYETANDHIQTAPDNEHWEIRKALTGKDVFSWKYQKGTMQSKAAVPVYAYGTLVGCVLIMEYDADQGALIQSLQQNTLTLTIILGISVIVFSVIFSRTYSRRLRQIMASMRIIREGDYSYRLKMGGKDELKVLGEEFNDLTTRLQESERKRQQFVSDASHELKTPLASIKLLTDSILQNEMNDETMREFVNDIGTEADRLNRMSQKLLSLSRLESLADEEKEILPISPTVQKVVRMLSILAEKNDVTIESDFKCDCPVLVIEDDLYQIIFNLVENGIKYNISGGTLKIKLECADDNMVLTVEDTGVGIPEDAQTHVFERFYRVDKARSRKSGGSGLGLSIVRAMVQRNGGEITMSSEIGKGTKFTLSFPIFDINEETLDTED